MATAAVTGPIIVITKLLPKNAVIFSLKLFCMVVVVLKEGRNAVECK